MEQRRRLAKLYDEVVAALPAERLVREACAAGVAPKPGPAGKLSVMGVGKVCVEMFDGARAAGLAIAEATLAVPPGAGRDRDRTPARLYAGDHPVPDQGSLAAGEALLRAAAALRPHDAALLLISGGGSALAEAPAEGLSLADVRGLNEALLRSGAPIEEMNCIRAHVSRFKGGGAARALHVAGVRRAVALVLVDVPRGGAPAVSSGPFAPDVTTFAGALEIVRARSISLPPAVQRRLEEGARGRLPETLKPGEPGADIEHRVLVDMRSPAQMAERLCRALDPEAPIARVAEVVRGPVEQVARDLEAHLSGSGPRFVVASGEAELRVAPGAPPGGRAQHLALRMARALRGRRGAFLAAGTDGRDGPTSAAGAVVDGTTWDEALRRGQDPDAALQACAATPLLESLSATLPARATGAHAGDVMVLWLQGGPA